MGVDNTVVVAGTAVAEKNRTSLDMKTSEKTSLNHLQSCGYNHNFLENCTFFKFSSEARVILEKKIA
jgi:hypothetical protein